MVGLDKISAKSYKTKMIEIPDAPKFHEKLAIDLILYKNWLLEIKSKLQANKNYILTESLKMSYIQNLMADKALAQISTQIGDNATQLFTTAKKLLNMLTARFDNPNEKEKTKAAYRSLRQSTKEFSSFWAKF